MSQEVDAEKATGLKHILWSVLPSKFLAPWMGYYRNRQMLLVSIEEKVSKQIGELLERQTYLHSIPREQALTELDEGEIIIDDANTMFAICLGIDSQVTHDMLPSEAGLRTRQAISLGSAQKTGQYTEPKDRSWIDKRLGRNKPEKQVSGGDGR